jgi:dTMP kinase
MFISFEGIDFSGKSTQIKLLESYLLKQNKKVKVIREPGGTEISEEIRTTLLNNKHKNMFMETEIFLFSASRAQLVREKIRAYMEEGIYVISDRFFDSTTAYQGYGRGISIESVNHINKLAVGDTIPDITFFIDIPASVAGERKAKKHKSLDRIENPDNDFFDRVRNGYLQISKSEKRFIKIDGMKKINEIHNYILNEIITFEEKKKI